MGVGPLFEEVRECEVNVPGVVMVNSRGREECIETDVCAEVEDEINKVSLDGGNDMVVGGGKMKVVVDEYREVILEGGYGAVMVVLCEAGLQGGQIEVLYQEGPEFCLEVALSRVWMGAVHDDMMDEGLRVCIMTWVCMWLGMPAMLKGALEWGLSRRGSGFGAGRVVSEECELE